MINNLHSKILTIFFLLSILSNLYSQKSDKHNNIFLNQQLKFSRVKESYKEKKEIIESKISNLGLKLNNFNILFVAKKEEKILELYVKNKKENKYILYCKYEICQQSGVLGPKREEGDYQVPEGLYQIIRFNPTSQFYLSLGISYPNESDKIIIKNKKTGGDIYIHGSCVTIGCIPMTDDIIKEIYLLCVFAKNNGQNNIPVYIFPCSMSGEKYEKILKENIENKKLIKFWTNLKTAYDKFYSNYIELKYSINSKGEYKI